MSHRLRSAWPHPPTHRLLAVVAAVTMLACGGDAEPTAVPVSPLVSPPVSLSVSPSGLSLIVGDQRVLTAQALDSKGRVVNASFEWSSANPTIATARNSDGTVTAISAGTTTVTARIGTLSATATVSVQAAGPPVRVSISTPALSLIVGGVERLIATAYDSTGRATRQPPYDSTGRATSASFEWSSADLAVATVDKTDGTVTAISDGSTTVTVAIGALRATTTVSVVAIAGAFAFTRVTQSGSGTDFTSDVFVSLVADRTIRSLPHNGPFASIAAPAWSPDGALLAVEGIHAFFTQDGDTWWDYASDLYVRGAAVPADSSWRQLTANGLSKSPSWSPDGKRIAYLQQPAVFSERNDVYVVDAGGGPPVRVSQATGWYSRPRWSPDGTRLAFSVFVEGGSVYSEILIVNADGGGLTRITRGGTSDADPSWSPDGSRLAFVRLRNDPPGTGTYYYDVSVADVDGNSVRRLASMNNTYVSAPVWSLDGRQIIFSGWPALYVMNADGSSLARLTTPPPNSWDSAPVWKR